MEGWTKSLRDSFRSQSAAILAVQSRHAAIVGRRPADRGKVRHRVQQRSLAQRHPVHRPGRQAGRQGTDDPGRPRGQAGRRPGGPKGQTPTTPREDPSMRRPEIRLTMTNMNRTIPSAGQTEAGSAGMQPARASRPGLRPQVDAGIQPPSGRWIPGPLAACGRSSPMPQKIHLWNTKNRPAVGRISSLAELGPRPIQAEPVQVQEPRS